MKAEYINPFLSASLNLFKEFLKLNLTHGKPFIQGDDKDLNEVSAIIGLAGDITGAIVLSFPRDTAIQMVSRLENHEYRALSREVLDGVGEMVNIIAGNAKKDLLDYRIDISLPGVITGATYKVNWPQGIPVITIPFESEIGPFTVNVSFKQAG